jgi:hypothetical protein
MPDHTNDTIVKILWVVAIAFFASFAKELNDKAKDPKQTFLLFVSEVLLNGVCGAITGVLAFNFTGNIYTISAVSAVGGLLGINLIKYVARIGIVQIAALKNISMDDLNKVSLDDETEKDNKVLVESEDKKENAIEVKPK